MAKLQVSPELIASFLFGDELVNIVGARMDGDIVVFDIEGPSVPDTEAVKAVFAQQRFSVRFEPI